MKRLLFAAVTATLAAGAAAQQPAQPNPRDAVPDKMPFDLPYGSPISLDRAQAAINQEVKELNAEMARWRRLADAAEAKYSPSQPRIPARNSGGGLVDLLKLGPDDTSLVF